MADVKISQLPAATTPVDGTEVLPIVQSATTKQVSIANLTAGRAMSASSLTLTTPLAVTSGGTGISTTGAGTFVVSATANTISATATPTLGVQQTTQGTLTLANTAAGAWPVTLQSSNSATAAWTMTLPTAPAAANGYILTSTTTGVTSWTNPTALGVDLDVGTTAITNGTAGRVFFQGSGDVLQQSANLFWDNTNSYLGIGTASPSSALTVSGLATFAKGSTSGITIGDVSTNSNSQLRLQGTSAGNNFLLANNFNVAGFEITPSTATGGTTYSNPVYSVTGAGLHKWYYGTTNSMTLFASGGLAVGSTTDPGVNNIQLAAGGLLRFSSTSYITPENNVSGAEISTTGIITFKAGTGAADRARIDGSGNLLVGNTSQIWDERFLAHRTTDAVVGGFYSSSSSYTSSVIRAQTETTAGTGWYFFEGRSAGGGFQYGIRGNGTVATSDERRKKNIETTRDGYLNDLNKLRVVKYNWKNDEENSPKELGLIAQEVEKIFPGLVINHYDGPNDDQEVKVIKKDVFVTIAIKAIQELSAKLDAAEARIASLEGN